MQALVRKARRSGKGEDADNRLLEYLLRLEHCGGGPDPEGLFADTGRVYVIHRLMWVAAPGKTNQKNA